MKLSLVIPVHNEEAILGRNALLLYDYMKKAHFEAFEIIFVCNGCVDSSESICEGLAKDNPGIRCVAIAERGLGRAIKKGAEEASYEAVMFYAIDLPFGLDVVGASAKAAEYSGAVVIGSKGHRDSVVRRGLARSLFSGTISIANNLLFGLGVKDTQGSLLFYKEPLRRYGALMDDPGAFFQTQVLIYSRLSGFELREIPVVLSMELRKTRFRLMKDGFNYLRALLKERVKMSRAGAKKEARPVKAR